MPPSNRSRHHPPDPGSLTRESDAPNTPSGTETHHQMMEADLPPPPPTGIDQLWDTITRSRIPDGSVRILAETFGILHVMIKDLRLVQNRLDTMAAQLERVDELTRKVEELSSNKRTHDLPKKPTSWAAVAKTNTNPTGLPPLSQHRMSALRPPPLNREVNEFKPAQVIIRNANTEKVPFEDQSTAEITDCINFALTTLDIKPTGASEPVKVRSAVQLPNGDIKLYTQPEQRPSVSWNTVTNGQN